MESIASPMDKLMNKTVWLCLSPLGNLSASPEVSSTGGSRVSQIMSVFPGYPPSQLQRGVYSNVSPFRSLVRRLQPCRDRKGPRSVLQAASVTLTPRAGDDNSNKPSISDRTPLLGGPGKAADGWRRWEYTNAVLGGPPLESTFPTLFPS